jgi:hypothetical protein
MDPVTLKMVAQLGATVLRHRSLRWLAVGLALTSIGAGIPLIVGPWMLTVQLAAGLRAQQQNVTDGGSCGDRAGFGNWRREAVGRQIAAMPSTRG